MAGGTVQQPAEPVMNWQDKYIDRLANDMQSIRGDMNAMRSRLDSTVESLKNQNEAIGRHVQNLTMAVMVGVGAMVVAAVIGIASIIVALKP